MREGIEGMFREPAGTVDDLDQELIWKEGKIFV